MYVLHQNKQIPHYDKLIMKTYNPSCMYNVDHCNSHNVDIPK